MAEGHVYSQPEAHEAVLRDALRILQSELAYVIQTRVEDIAFAMVSEDGPAALWPEGRAFGAGAEMRWHQAGPGRYNLLVLSEAARNLEGDWVTHAYQENDEGPDGGPLRIYLWGTWQPAMAAWVEVRIPRPLPYPISPPDRSKRHRIYVTAAEYARDGMVRFIRWRMLQTEEV